MRTILQSQAAECSLACLAMVGSAHGLQLDLPELRRRFPVSLKGSNLKQLMAQAAALGFAGRPLRLDLDEIGQLQRPCILHWNLNHFVVLKQVHGKRAVTILDPAVGERRLPMAEVSRHFTGVALELSPNADFKPEEKVQRVRLGQLTGKVRGLGTALLQIFVVALVLELFAICAPLLNQLVVDDAVVSQDRELLNVLVLGFGLLLLIQTVLGLARSWMVLLLSQNVALQWVGNVFAHLVRLPVSYFEQRHLGDISSRFSSVQTIQRTLTTAAVEAVLDGIMATAALVMMLLYAPSLAGVVAAAVGAYALLRWAMWRPLRNASAERLVVGSREQSHFLETLRAIQPLKLFGREEERRARWQNLIVEVQNRDLRTARLGVVFSTSNTFIFGVENLLVLWLGARLIMESGQAGSVFTVGMLMAFLSYKMQFTGRVSKLIDYLFEFRMLGLHSERLADIALTPPERDTADGSLPEHDLAHLKPTLELRNVSFRYGDGEPWVLRHAHLKIEAGESVAIVGASGCGKTTMLKLLLGIHTPTEGEVLYGGVPLRHLGLANVRRRIGTVMQDDTLLSGSLADNITFFDTEADMERAMACARLAQLHEDIGRMPMGYHTLVGDLGSGLSGGQKQRLLLARALYRRPTVLALDEATSHLDVPTERTLAASLAAMRLTRIIIAHRPETIASAQRVVLVQGGATHEVPRWPQAPTAVSVGAHSGAAGPPSAAS